MVESWLKPFIPDFSTFRQISITKDEIPDDVVFSGESDDLQFGRSPTNPNMTFAIGSSGPFCMVFDCERKSLLVLLSVLLGEHIVRSPAESILYPAAEKHDFPRLFQELCVKCPGHHPAEVQHWLKERQGEENSNAICERLVELMGYNECNDTFRLGRDFGRVVAMCEDLAERLTKLEWWDVESAAMETRFPRTIEEDFDPDVDDWGTTDDLDESEYHSALDGILYRGQLESYATVLKGLGTNPLVQRSMYAVQCLADCSLPQMEWCVDEKFFDHKQRDAIQHANRSRMRLWLAFGELLGFLRNVDSLARTAEWTSTSPRTFRELFDTSGDKVRRAVRDAEVALSEETSGEEVAAKVVGMLANGIEALAKRVWPIQPSHSQQSHQNGLSRELWSKLESGTETEQRFASIAITLYKQYRNPIVHDLEKFRCSLNEARFFVMGMRTLLELSERIQTPGEGGK